ncbi:MFS transporter [Nonomuraea aurantiaca]|uniref:MFS transporter n=1 Tax=Nonomuraea aurantiaca TaxID=2878562 RepID=UPI001CD923ED|nr:MFS transporter [Nonomuraea aurantiaca]MCA2226525.1 MFS transporter [Nonomuraea aurantiaca]
MRLARAMVFAVVCAAVTAAGHAFAGGAAVAPGVMVAGGLGALGLAYVLSGRERGPEVVLGATVGTQASLHKLFELTAPSTGHAHFAVGMVLVHLTIAVLTGWWLHRGESAFWLMLRLSGRPRLTLPRPFHPIPAIAAALVRPAPARAPLRTSITVQIATAEPRRGPPTRGVTESPTLPSSWSSPCPSFFAQAFFAQAFFAQPLFAEPSWR